VNFTIETDDLASRTTAGQTWQAETMVPGFRQRLGNGKAGQTRIRVCHLGKFYPPASGGIETHLQTLARAQARLGLHAEVLCVNHRNAGGDDVTWRNFARTPTMTESDGLVGLNRLGRRASLARLDFCPGLLRRLASLSPADYDLLHLHIPNPTMLLGVRLARPRVPWVITYHSDVVRQKLLLRLQRPFENWVFNRSEAIIATSPEYWRGSTYLQRFGDKVTMVPFGIDLTEYLRPGPAARRWADHWRRTLGDPLWLAVGRLVYYKGLHNAIRALASVPGWLMIVGDGPLRSELEQLAHAQGVSRRVAWHARLSTDELVGAYHAATALWFPSNARSEAFGLVQVEAMASGLPVINSAIAGSGVPWVSRDGDSGLTVPVDDWQTLARAALRLWQDVELRRRLSHGARERARRDFDADSMAERILRVYEQALARPCFPSPGVLP
jgi:rhamnosyl/mannosyltransferase